MSNIRPGHVRIDASGKCARCNADFKGYVELTDRLTVFDTVGFIIAGSRRPRLVCDRCAAMQGFPGPEIVDRPEDITPRDVAGMIRALTDLDPSN